MAETGVWALFAFSTHVGLTAASTSDADLMVMDDDADVVDTKCQRSHIDGSECATRVLCVVLAC